jgi:hypothetical protein
LVSDDCLLTAGVNAVSGNGMTTSLTKARIEAAYERALADEQRFLKLLPRAAAKEAKRKNAAAFAALGFSSAGEQELQRFLNSRPDLWRDRRATADRYRAAHQEAMVKSMPDYRPSELTHANLQESWTPYAELLLREAAQLEGANFSALKPQLEELGFEKKILDYFRATQGRKYFLQQTAASVATLIVSRHLDEEGIVIEQDTVKRAGNRVYSRVRSKKKRE